MKTLDSTWRQKKIRETSPGKDHKSNKSQKCIEASAKSRPKIPSRSSSRLRIGEKRPNVSNVINKENSAPSLDTNFSQILSNSLDGLSSSVLAQLDNVEKIGLSIESPSTSPVKKKTLYSKEIQNVGHKKGVSLSSNIPKTTKNISPTATIKDTSPSRSCNLEDWDLPSTVLEQYKDKGITCMFQWQAECLSVGKVLKGGNLVYSAPTSAGKTMVAELLMLKCVLERQKKALMILPFVSLAREKMFYLQNIFQDAGIRVDGFMGNHNPPGGLASVDIAICTIEKANSIINRLLEEGKLDQLGILVVDELHIVGDSHRGYLLELLLTKVLFKCKRNGDTQTSIQIIGMSATLPNLDTLASWLDADLYQTNFRPVPLKEYVKISNQIYDTKTMTVVREVLNASNKLSNGELDQDHCVLLCLETITAGHSVLVFCPTKQWCETLAGILAREIYYLGSAKTEAELKKMSESNRDFGVKLREVLNGDHLKDVYEQLKRSPAGLDSVLGKTVPFGVAFHHAGLTFDERDIIEGAFKNGHVKILVATTTLSSGVNLPARRVIIRSPLSRGTTLDILCYKQMVGRAGRQGIDTKGESILICKENERSKAKILATSEINPVKSCLINHGSLSSSLKRAILEIIASGIASTPSDVALYASCTFLATCVQKDCANNDNNDITNNAIESCIQYLVANEFIHLQTIVTGKMEDRYTPTQLGKAVLASSLNPDEGLNLLSELKNAHRCFVLENELHLVYQVTPPYLCSQIGSLDWYHFLSLWERLPEDMKRVGEMVGVEERFLAKAIRGVIKSAAPKQVQALAIHQRFYIALALNDLVQEMQLSKVSEKYCIPKGVLQSLQQGASTFSGMVTAFCNRLGWKNMELLISQFQSRLHFGIHQDLCDLVRLNSLNAQTSRMLYDAGYETAALLANADPQDLEIVFKNAGPFRSTKIVEDDPKGNQYLSRCVWIAGRKGMTEKEASELVINEARFIVQQDFGIKEIKWNTIENSKSKTVIGMKDNELLNHQVESDNVIVQEIRSQHEMQPENINEIQTDINEAGPSKINSVLIINEHKIQSCNQTTMNKDNHKSEISDENVLLMKSVNNKSASASKQSSFAKSDGKDLENNNAKKLLERTFKEITPLKRTKTVTLNVSLEMENFYELSDSIDLLLDDDFNQMFNRTADKVEQSQTIILKSNDAGQPLDVSADETHLPLNLNESADCEPKLYDNGFHQPTESIGLNLDFTTTPFCEKSSIDLTSPSSLLKTKPGQASESSSEISIAQKNQVTNLPLGLELEDSDEENGTFHLSESIDITPMRVKKNKKAQFTIKTFTKIISRIAVSNKSQDNEKISSVQLLHAMKELSERLSPNKNTKPDNCQNISYMDDISDFDSPFLSSQLQENSSLKNDLLKEGVPGPSKLIYTESEDLFPFSEDVQNESIHNQNVTGSPNLFSESLNDDNEDILNNGQIQTQSPIGTPLQNSSLRSVNLDINELADTSSNWSINISNDVLFGSNSRNIQINHLHTTAPKINTPLNTTNNSKELNESFMKVLKKMSPYLSSQFSDDVIEPSQLSKQSPIFRYIPRTELKKKVNLKNDNSPNETINILKKDIEVGDDIEHHERVEKEISHKLTTAEISKKLNYSDFEKSLNVTHQSFDSDCIPPTPESVSNVSHFPANSKTHNLTKLNATESTLVNPKLFDSSSTPGSNNAFSIIDVASNTNLFKKFFKELKTKHSFSLAIACEKCNLNLAATGIGSKILKGFSKESIKPDNELSTEKLKLVGIAICWGDKKSYFLSLEENRVKGDTNKDEGLYGSTLDDSLSFVERFQAFETVLTNKSKNISISVFDIKQQFRTLNNISNGIHLSNINEKIKWMDPKVADWLLDHTGIEKSIHGLVRNYLPGLLGYIDLLEPLGTINGKGFLGGITCTKSASRVRACIEAVISFNLMETLSEKLNEASLTNSFMNIEMPVQLILAQMDENGFGFDSQGVINCRSELQKHMSVLEKQAYQLAKRTFSLTSNADIAKVLYRELRLKLPGKRIPVTSRNKECTNKATLNKLKKVHPLPGIILEFRKISCAISKVICPLIRATIKCTSTGIERVFSECYTFTATGRVIMKEPNVQNIPKDFDISENINYSSELSNKTISIRNFFIPYKGASFLGADYSQLELRLLAHFCQDKKLLHILNSGEDVFVSVAAEWLNISKNEVTKEQRQRAKQISYGMIYGIGAKSLADELDVEEIEAFRFMESFKNTYPEIKVFMAKTINACRAKGYVETIFGRRRFLPSINSSNLYEKASAERQALNTTVQGSAADLVKLAMIRIHEEIKSFMANKWNVKPVNLVLQLHDELIYEVPTCYLRNIAKIMKMKMEGVAPSGIKLPVCLKSGQSWGRLTDYNI